MPNQPPPDRSARRLLGQGDHGTNAFRRFRRGLDEASRQEVPRLPPEILFGTVIALAAAIGFAFAPWVRYELDDGTIITESGVRSDGLVLVLAALIAIGALVVANRSEPGDASFPALIGFGACVIGLGAAGNTMMDPGYILIESEPDPVPLTRGWGLICDFLVMLAATWGAFRLWRIADHY
jgi:hypothetical protein